MSDKREYAPPAITFSAPITLKADLPLMQQRRLALLHAHIDREIRNQIGALRELQERLFLPQEAQRPCYPAASHIRAYGAEGSQMGTERLQRIGYESDLDMMMTGIASLGRTMATYNALIEGYEHWPPVKRKVES